MSLEYKVKIAQTITNILKLKFNTSIDNIASTIKVNLRLTDNKISYLYPLDSYVVLPKLLFEKNDIIQGVRIVDFTYKKYIQFFIDEKKFIPDILTADVDSNTLFHYREPSKCVVEFSSPNIGKPFLLSHLRSTIVGNFISNISKYLNDEVIQLNYVGDWGTRAGLIYNGLEDLNIKDDTIFQSPLKTLHQVYANVSEVLETNNFEEYIKRARKIFCEMEMSESHATKRWYSFRKYIIEELSFLYSRLNVTFDEYFWESDYSNQRIRPLINDLKSKDILIKNKDNLYVVEADTYSEQIPFLKEDETTLYLARDVATALDRYERYKFDKMLCVVDNSQIKHFKVLKEILIKMDAEFARKLEHVRYGFILGICTRKKWLLDEIISEIERRMEIKQMKSASTKEVVDAETAFTLGISAIVVNDLKKIRASNYEFDWDSVLRATGYTGIFMQYTHCKLYTLENNCSIKLPTECDPDVLTEPEALNLVKEIARFEDVLIRSYNNLEGYILVQYLFTLCDSIQITLEKLKIEAGNEHVASQRLLLFRKARLVLNNGIKILGLKPLDKM